MAFPRFTATESCCRSPRSYVDGGAWRSPSRSQCTVSVAKFVCDRYKYGTVRTCDGVDNRIQTFGTVACCQDAESDSSSGGLVCECSAN